MKTKKLWLVALLVLVGVGVALAANEPVGTWMGLAPGSWSPYSSPAPENNTAVKASQATLVSACYTNQTVNDLTILVFNSATVPADGAVTPVGCGPVPKATTTLVNAGCYTPPVPMNFSVGLSVAVSSGPNCYLKTSPGSPSGMFTVQFK